MGLIDQLSIIGGMIMNRGNDLFTQTPSTIINQMRLGKGTSYVTIDNNEHFLYQTTPQLQIVLNRGASMLSTGVYKHIDKNRVEIENSPFVKLLNNPNPLQTGKELLIQNYLQKNVYGNSFEYENKPTLLKVPNALWNLPPAYIKIKRTGKIWKQTKKEDIIKNYTLINDDNEKEEEFEVNQIIHRTVANLNDPIMGESPFKALQMPISNIRASYGFRNVTLTEMGAIGILSNKSASGNGAMPVTNSERERIEKEYHKTYGMQNKKRKVLITNSALSWTAMSYPTKDMMVFEEIDDNTATIIDRFGFSNDLFSRSKGSTFQNYLTAMKSAYQDTIIPYAESHTEAYTKRWGLDLKGEKIVLDYSHIPVLQLDKAEESKILQTKAKAIETLKKSELYTNEEIKDIVTF